MAYNRIGYDLGYLDMRGWRSTKLAELAERLVDRFGGRVAERYLEIMRQVANETTEANEMAKRMYVQLAPIRLKDGVDEQTLLDASDAFQVSFVSRQAGIMKRVLLKGRDGSYAGLVFFESKENADRVARIEDTAQECLEFSKIMQAPDASLPDMGILSFEHVKTYE